MAKTKPNMNVVFVGHVDAGKSTCIGRLMYDSGMVPEQQMTKLKEEAAKHNKAGFEFAYVMDNIKEERERGVTIDLSYKKLITQKFEITIIDAPGHRDFVKNMITGASQADAAFLVVDVMNGVQPQTTEHLWLLRTMGVKHVAVLVNKMDMGKFEEAKYTKVKDDVSALLKQVGINPETTNFLAVSGLLGENIAKKSDKMPWYKGPTLLEQFDLFPQPELPTNLPLRMPIQDVYEITGIGTVPVGKIETGVMKVGDKVIVVPGREGKGVTGEVKSIEMHHSQMQKAGPGDNIGFSVRGIEKQDIAKGDVLGLVSSPPTVAKEFTAQLVVMNHPSVITVGYTPVFHIHTAQVACRVIEIIKTINPATGETLADHPDFIKNGDIAYVKFAPMTPLVIEKQSDNPKLSRFAVRDSSKTVAAGVCIDVVKKE